LRYSPTSIIIEAMDVILVGYGQMGKVVEAVLQARNHRVIAKVDPVSGDRDELSPELAEKADCAIEFSVPDSVLTNIRFYCENNLNAVVGTTGWYDHLEEVQKLVSKKKMAFIYASNYSIGAQIFFKLVGVVSRIINPFPEYDILGYEIHHKRKKDSPSGTAQEITRIILDNNQRKNILITEKIDRPIKENELHFASVRGGDFPGIHKVLIDSEADSIELKHTARNRGGFALGAVLAAEWLRKKRGFFKIDDFVNDILADTNRK
jgi:4-hydroxy-tetrahydrodipicolinate reductase